MQLSWIRFKVSFWHKQVVQPALDRDVEAAIAEQRAILERDPGNAHAVFALGTLSHFCGQTDAAIRYFQRAIEIDSSYAAPHLSLGRIHVVAGRYEEAWREAQEAARLGDRSLLDQMERYPHALERGESRVGENEG